MISYNINKITWRDSILKKMAVILEYYFYISILWNLFIDFCNASDKERKKKDKAVNIISLHLQITKWKHKV